MKSLVQQMFQWKQIFIKCFITYFYLNFKIVRICLNQNLFNNSHNFFLLWQISLLAFWNDTFLQLKIISNRFTIYNFLLKIPRYSFDFWFECIGEALSTNYVFGQFKGHTFCRLCWLWNTFVSFELGPVRTSDWLWEYRVRGTMAVNTVIFGWSHGRWCWVAYYFKIIWNLKKNFINLKFLKSLYLNVYFYKRRTSRSFCDRWLRSFRAFFEKGKHFGHRKMFSFWQSFVNMLFIFFMAKETEESFFTQGRCISRGKVAEIVIRVLKRMTVKIQLEISSSATSILSFFLISKTFNR